MMLGRQRGGSYVQASETDLIWSVVLLWLLSQELASWAWKNSSMTRILTDIVW